MERLFKPKIFLVTPIIVALLLAPLLTFVTPQPAKAAIPDGWVNRYAINYGGRIFIDPNTYDGNREYVGPAETDGCPPDTLTFLGPGSLDNADYGAFYYSRMGEVLASSPESFKQYEKVRNDVTEECQVRETVGAALRNSIANVQNRRIVMYLDSATDKIMSLYNASVVFERAGNTTLGSKTIARYARNGDTEACRDLILNASTIAADGDYFANNRPNSWLLYSVMDNSPTGTEKLSESYRNVVPGTQRICQMDFSDDDWNRVLGTSGYGLTSNDDPQKGALVMNGLDSAGNPAGGDSYDDAFAIFIGNNDNVMPAGSGNSGTPNQCQIPGKNTLPKDHPDCKSATPQVCTVGEQGLASALAWIICPITALISDFTQFVEKNIIIPYLTVNPLVATTDTADPRSIPYRLWDGFRNLANVGFIIGFFIIIFTTALGNFNYGIKRMLPKFFVLIILTNISFFLVAWAIDVFNLLGAGIGSFAANTVLQPLYQDPKFAAAYPTPNAGQIFALLGGLIAAIALTGGGALGWLFGLMLAAALVIAVAVIVLVVRQILILALAVVSPLILLAFMLPNLENYGRKGISMMGNLLAMYPIIVLLFAAGKIGATLFALPATAAIISPGGGTASNEVTDAVRVAMMFLATVLPLGALPFVMVATGGLIGKAYQSMRGAATRGSKSLRESDAAQRAKGLMSSKVASSPTLGKLSGRPGGRFVLGLAGYGRTRRRKVAATGAAYTEALNKDFLAEFTAAGIAGDKSGLLKIASANPNSGRGQAAISQLAGLGASDQLMGLKKQIIQNEGPNYANSRAYKTLSAAVGRNAGTILAKAPDLLDQQGIGSAADAFGRHTSLDTIKKLGTEEIIKVTPETMQRWWDLGGAHRVAAVDVIQRAINDPTLKSRFTQQQIDFFNTNGIPY